MQKNVVPAEAVIPYRNVLSWQGSWDGMIDHFLTELLVEPARNTAHLATHVPMTPATAHTVSEKILCSKHRLDWPWGSHVLCVLQQQ